MQSKNEQRRTLIKDPLWDETLEMGPEGLIATVDDPKELLAALKKNMQRTKEKCKPQSISSMS